MTLAFKEWSSIVNALGSGRQSIILRKGGIIEENGQFEIKGKKFLLFPTLFHEAPKYIKDQWLPYVQEEKFYKSPQRVRLQYYAEIADVIVVSDWEKISKLNAWHAWKEDVIKERFNRWEKNVNLLILQVYELITPIEIEVLPEYGGCKSWIEIQEDIELIGKEVINKAII